MTLATPPISSTADARSLEVGAAAFARSVPCARFASILPVAEGLVVSWTSLPGLAYAELRLVETDEERLVVRNRSIETIARHQTRGVGIRVLAQERGAGGWGFAATTTLTEAGLVDAFARAWAIARLAAGLHDRLQVVPVAFPPRAAVTGAYRTPLVIDPFRVSIDKKVDDLLAPHETLLDDPRIRAAETWMDFSCIHKLLCTSEGTRIAQSIVSGGAGMSVVAVDERGDTQRRSYPGLRGSEVLQKGYERVAELDLVGHAEQIREEALALLAAPVCPIGERTVVLGSNQMALQIHESCGHPTELDRALGSEISLAGGSFLRPEMLDRFRYGSELVSLTADAVTPFGLGTFGWDDEGTQASTHHLIHEGIFVNYLSSRESAAALGRESTGAMRAAHHGRTPLVRMLNVSLVPREGSLDDLIADTADGILLDSNKSWSIDDLRLGFQFGCEVAWEIKRGKRVRLLRDAVYAGTTPAFWGSCDAICGPESAQLWGIATCGKGDPGQTMAVGHGAPPARFHGVSVGHS
jgi:TldD protein